MRLILTLITVLPSMVMSQNYTSYFTGNANDLITEPSGGICLMGGATEDDQAMIWFLEKANGGDVLVLRASGADGYNNYFHSTLGVNLNSVETIVCHNAMASQEAYIVQKIQKAEAIWFAGGDQWNYVSYWRNSPIATAINEAIANRNIVIGGTSAGMAILGQYYFSAQNGSVTSNASLSNPFDANVTVDGTPFLDNEILSQTITDTHFDNPDRKGRLTTFLARMHTDYGILGKAIACDEYTAVCIEPSGLARVFGGFPNYDDNAYFIQTNCELTNPSPENISPNIPLTWNHNGQALKVYQVKGTPNGNNTFDLNLWETGNGGEWKHWSVNNGAFLESNGTPINCVPLSNNLVQKESITGFPNPTREKFILSNINPDLNSFELKVFTFLGQEIKNISYAVNNEGLEINVASLQTGNYLVNYQDANTSAQFKVMVRRD